MLDLRCSQATRTSRFQSLSQVTGARALWLVVALGALSAACAAGADESLEGANGSEDVVGSEQALTKQPLAAKTTAAIGSKLTNPPTGVDPGTTVVYFQCGWDPKSLSAQCKCSGDADCNRMFTSGFCGASASCDSGAGTCTCDLKL
jgi:hypothetical protein